MFWIQESGLNKNNPGYKLFYAESFTDISHLPTDKKEGTQTGGDTVSNKICALGSECLCIENSKKYVLTTSGWEECSIKVFDVAEVATDEEGNNYLFGVIE